MSTCTSNKDTFNGAISGQLIRDADPDAFRSGGLTPSSLQILDNLSADPARPSRPQDLVIATGRCRSTIDENLKRLEDCQLSFRVNGGWCRLDGSVEALTEHERRLAAEVLGTAGETNRQIERYEHERMQYRSLVELFSRRSGTFEIGEDERFAALPDEAQEWASDLAMLALEQHADLGIMPPTSFASMRRAAFRLVIAAPVLPYETLEEQAAYIAR